MHNHACMYKVENIFKDDTRSKSWLHLIQPQLFSNHGISYHYTRKSSASYILHITKKINKTIFFHKGERYN